MLIGIEVDAYSCFEALLGVDTQFDRAVMLLQDIVQVLQGGCAVELVRQSADEGFICTSMRWDGSSHWGLRLVLLYTELIPVSPTSDKSVLT